MKKIIICLFLSVGLSGCHIYRAYERPDEVVADSLYRQSVAAEDTVSLASLSWKELFTDPQLQQLIDIGIRKQKHYYFLLSWLICPLSPLLHKGQ